MGKGPQTLVASYHKQLLQDTTLGWLLTNYYSYYVHVYPYILFSMLVKAFSQMLEELILYIFLRTSDNS